MERVQLRMSRRGFIGRGLAFGSLLFTGLPSVFAGEGDLKIGALLSFTGPLSPFSESLQNSIELARGQVNAAGGPLGRDLGVLYRDSATDPVVGADAAKRLVEIDGVPAFIGPLASGVNMAVLNSVTASSEAVQISPSATAPIFTEISAAGEDNGYFFRTTASDALQGLVTGRIPKDEGHETISIIFVNNPYGEGLKDVAQKTFTDLGGEVLESIPYEEGLPSYRGEVDRAGKVNPDALLLIAYPEDGITITREWLEMGYEQDMIVTCGLKSRDWVDAIGWDNLEGVKGTSMGSEETLSREYFLRDYAGEFGEPPPYPFMTNIYDALSVLALSIQHAGEEYLQASRVERARMIRDSLRPITNPPGEAIYAGEFEKAFRLLALGREIHYIGAAGRMDFDVHGDVTTPIEVWTIEQGEIVVSDLIDVGVGW